MGRVLCNGSVIDIGNARMSISVAHCVSSFFREVGHLGFISSAICGESKLPHGTGVRVYSFWGGVVDLDFSEVATV